MSSYEVAQYKFETLMEFFADTQQDVNRSKDSLSSRTNALYFRDYLEVCSTKIIVVENEYVDRDYLNDYAAYYVRCFADMRKKTKRIHFFRNIEFDAAAFLKAITGSEPNLLKRLQDPANYVGFIVIKPLPETFIGRTCLIPYPKVGGEPKHQRHYPISTRYKANLFGVPLSVESIAFQEQDKEVAACATSALWSLFHASETLFDHEVPSPHAITLAASQQIADWQLSNPETRRFPSRGLTIGQIAGAIRDVGLEAYLIGLKADLLDEEKQSPDQSKLKPQNAQQLPPEPKPKGKHIVNPAIYAYLSGGIPVLMTVKLMEQGSSGEQVSHGDHAVTVLGYGTDESTDTPPVIRFNRSEMSFRSMRIDRIYVHDDQIGPFARMRWKDDDLLETSWHYLSGRTIVAKPHCLFIPLSDRVRIPYETVERAVIQVNELIRTYVVQQAGSQIEWDIRLSSVNQFKNEVRLDSALSQSARGEILTKHFPKYIWLATGYLRHGADFVKHIQFVIDATAIEQEGGLREVVPYQQFLTAAFAQAAQAYDMSGRKVSTLAEKLVERFRTLL